MLRRFSMLAAAAAFALIIAAPASAQQFFGSGGLEPSSSINTLSNTIVNGDGVQIVGANSNRLRVCVQNGPSSTVVLWLGGSGVTVNNGIAVYPGETRCVATEGALYGSTSAAIIVNGFEELE